MVKLACTPPLAGWRRWVYQPIAVRSHRLLYETFATAARTEAAPRSDAGCTSSSGGSASNTPGGTVDAECRRSILLKAKNVRGPSLTSKPWSYAIDHQPNTV